MKASIIPRYITVLALIDISIAQPASNCPLLGPVFPSAEDPAKTKAIQSATNDFSGIIDQAFSSGLLDNETTSFSISVFSANQETPLFSTHFASRGLNDSLPSGELNGDTIYRLGSITKLLTVYSILAQNGDVAFAKPVTDYVPELKNATFEDAIDSVRWCEVTVGSLASHMAGISRDCEL
jgi:CubicO group peptidase (beta-lactamase class C family)